ncbi:hypothetical protein BC937DRAFT_93836 [Endogone sp. FLAS-F59071]|nr:hypothetical protein BC937DRAFT_93836 [Endogone sp. FLAS-F59071]|eukprot:RUS21016.1 hypothetical protein BC937DRAFT_93836 [Endogone sp. FLAS-F59071]
MNPSFFEYIADNASPNGAHVTTIPNNAAVSTNVPESVSIANAMPEDTPAAKDGEPPPQSLNTSAPLRTCWRNMFWSINFLRILQRLTKKKTHRVMLLVQYKSSAILKRILKVSHPMLELYTLKVLKSQVPYLGKRWRSSMSRSHVLAT